MLRQRQRRVPEIAMRNVLGQYVQRIDDNNKKIIQQLSEQADAAKVLFCTPSAAGTVDKQQFTQHVQQIQVELEEMLSSSAKLATNATKLYFQ